MAEQYLHGGQEGKAWVVPGLSGPPLWKREPGGRVSLGLWAGPRKKSVPSQAHSGSHHVGLESPRSTRALEACAVRRSHGSELCHHAAGFGVSLVKDNRGRLRSGGLLPKSTANPQPQKPSEILPFPRVPSPRLEHRFPENPHLPSSIRVPNTPPSGCQLGPTFTCMAWKIHSRKSLTLV